MNGLPEHALWPEVKPLLRIQDYDRDGGHRHPRHRIELREPSTVQQRAAFLALQTECPACSQLVNPMRARTNDATIYVRVSCSPRCQRTQAASAEYERIVAAARSLSQPRVSRKRVKVCPHCGGTL